MNIEINSNKAIPTSHVSKMGLIADGVGGEAVAAAVRGSGTDRAGNQRADNSPKEMVRSKKPAYVFPLLEPSKQDARHLQALRNEKNVKGVSVNPLSEAKHHEVSAKSLHNGFMLASSKGSPREAATNAASHAFVELAKTLAGKNWQRQIAASMQLTERQMQNNAAAAAA